MDSVAVIGTGIAGMSCAHRIHNQVDLTLYEAAPEPGGHTHTVDLPDNERTVPVDSGFMVYNEKTYPLLTQLFADLGVETMETDMSFGVQYRPDRVEFCGSGISQLFAHRRNIGRPRFLRMLADIVRFNKLAVAELANPDVLDFSLVEFVRRHRFSRSFMEYYLIPMTSAIWSTPPDEMLQFPAHTLIRFMYNHGLLGIRTHHQWRTVKGGSRQYRDKLIAPFRDRIRCGSPVTSVRRHESGVSVTDASGKSLAFDKVVFATHADTTLRLIENPTSRERDLLACFPYAANTITLHTDTAVMPRSRRAWASWNYRVDEREDGSHQASTHYWMNRLQKVSAAENYFVSVNEPDIVDRDKVFKEFTFDHPMFSRRAVNAQFELPLLNENRKLYFCGSYFRYGFHEDGILSGYAAAERLLTHTAAHAEFAL